MEFKDITMIVAHPDDEILFFWPYLKHVKKLIACVDDITHPTRQWCRRRKDAFAEIGRTIGAETQVLRYDSSFASRSNKEIRPFVDDVRKAIQGIDAVVVHNSWGEYFHLDHIMLHQICRMEGKTIFTTDICFDADWCMPKAYQQGEIIGHAVNNIDQHNAYMNIYRKYGAMGWTYPPIKECNLIRISP